MYLSRLILNPRTRRVQRELGNPYELHRSLMRSFSEDLPPKERVLFRADVDPRTGIPTVLLQSHIRPDWGWLTDDGARDYLLPNRDLPPSIQPPNHLTTKPFDLTFTPGQSLAFRLRANPTIKLWLPKDKDDPSSEKKPMRLPVISRKALQAQFDVELDKANLNELREEALHAWLNRKGERGGFRVLRVTIIQEGNAYAWKSRKGGSKRKLTHFAARFEGLLQVTDPDALWASVQNGIGPAKSFGFGLLSLAPAH